MPQHSRPLAAPTVSALVPTIRPHQVENVFRTLASQQGVEVELVLLAHGFELDFAQVRELQSIYGLQNVQLLSAPRDVTLGECLNRCVEAASGEVVAKMDDDDHYGARYLSDQLHALAYSQAEIVGKQAHYVHLAGSRATILRNAEREHRYTDFVMGPTITTYRRIARENPFPALGLGEDTSFLRAASTAGLRIYSADRFNFFQIRSGAEHTWQIADAELLAGGELKFYGGPSEHTDI